MGASGKHLLLFGGSGAIGSSVADQFNSKGWRITRVVRTASVGADEVRWNPLEVDNTKASLALREKAPFEAVCWSQGANCNDSIYAFDPKTHQDLYSANVMYVIQSLNTLLTLGCLAKQTRMCVISSIWQNLARQEKLSYCVTKAALKGLILSASNDLGRDGHLINAVLPGVIDTPMTRTNLTQTQVENVVHGTQFNRLATLVDVASTVFMLCSPENTGLTGQFVNVDLGYSNVRII